MDSLDSQIDSQVTLDGTAMNAHAGAIVMMSDRTPVYLAGVDEWDPAAAGKKVSVSGTLRKRCLVPQAEVNQAGEVSHGMDGDSFILENASWQLQDS